MVEHGQACIKEGSRISFSCIMSFIKYVGSRAISRRGEQKGLGSAKVWPRAVLTNGSMESIDISFIAKSDISSHNSLSSDSDFSAPLHFGSTDAITQNLDLTNILDAANSGSSGSSSVSDINCKD